MSSRGKKTFIWTAKSSLSLSHTRTHAHTHTHPEPDRPTRPTLAPPSPAHLHPFAPRVGSFWFPFWFLTSGAISGRPAVPLILPAHCVATLGWAGPRGPRGPGGEPGTAWFLLLCLEEEWHRFHRRIAADCEPRRSEPEATVVCFLRRDFSLNKNHMNSGSWKHCNKDASPELVGFLVALCLYCIVFITVCSVLDRKCPAKDPCYTFSLLFAATREN